MLSVDKTERLEFIKLPLEVLHLIFVQAALGRGVKRALRLRLVCKTFADGVLPALFETHLMDNYFYFYVGSYQWQLNVGSKYGADKLWHKYLVFRVMDGRDKTVERFIQMRQLAQVICQEMERERESAFDLREIVESLCWLALKKGNSSNEYEWFKASEVRNPELRLSLGLNLFSAAAYFDLLPLAKRLVAEGHEPYRTTCLADPGDCAGR